MHRAVLTRPKKDDRAACFYAHLAVMAASIGAAFSTLQPRLINWQKATAICRFIIDAMG